MEMRSDNGERELRKWCLEQALAVHSNNPHLALGEAHKFYQFISPPPVYAAIEPAGLDSDMTAILSDGTGFCRIEKPEQEYRPQGDYNPLEEIRKAGEINKEQLEQEEVERLRTDPNAYHKAHMMKVQRDEKKKERERNQRIEEAKKNAAQVEQDTVTGPRQHSQIQPGTACLSGHAKDQAPENGLSQSRSDENGEKSQFDTTGHREGIPDRKPLPVQPDAGVRNNNAGPERGHEVLNDEISALQISFMVHVCKQYDLNRNITAKQVAEVLGIRPGSVGYVTGELEHKGYIEKEKISPRVVHIIPLKRPDGREYKKPETDSDGVTRYEPGRAENYGHVDLDRL